MGVYENIFDKSKIKWNIVPADNKWYRDFLIAKELVKQLEQLKMKYPNKIN